MGEGESASIRTMKTLPGGTAVGFHGTLIECLAGDSGDGEFARTLVSLHSQCDRLAWFATHHEDDLLVGFPRHRGAVHGRDFIAVLQPGLVGGALGMDLRDIEQGWVADTFSPHVERHADHPLRKLRLITGWSLHRTLVLSFGSPDQTGLASRTRQYGAQETNQQPDRDAQGTCDHVMTSSFVFANIGAR